MPSQANILHPEHLVEKDRMKKRSTLILIVGAGAAGLAAARELSNSGVDVKLIEARERVGGRIHTLRDASFPRPLEAGAEFIHGTPEETQEAIDALRLKTEEVPDRFWELQGNQLVELDMEGKWSGVAERLKQLGDHDLPFTEFLERHCSDLSSDERIGAQGYVEGFHAVDAKRASSLWLREADEEQGQGESLRRIPEGQSALLAHFLEGKGKKRIDIQYRRRVTQIRWQRQSVELDTVGPAGEPETFRAAAAILTLPLGVLQAAPGQPGAVEFVPPVAKKKSVWKQMRMGSVVKVSILFRRPIWEQLAPELSFLHTPSGQFVAWWTQKPAAIPLLTGWSGGPRAAALSKLPESDIYQAALATIAECFQMRPEAVAEEVERWHVFNWQVDPLTCGAYAYVPADGLDLPAQLASPVEDTLFFAGEATSRFRMGTVAGAISSGIRAAKEVLAAID